MNKVEVEIQADDGQIISLDIPYHTANISFGEYLDFISADEEFVHKQNGKEAEEAARKAVGVIIGGDLDIIPFYDEISESDKLNSGELLGIDSTVSILTLYAHLVFLLKQYVPSELVSLKRFPLNYKGEEFHVIGKEFIKGVNFEMPLTAGEAVAISELRDFFSKKQKEDQNITNDLLFTLGLHEMAILLRKEGEDIPSDVVARRAFLDERGKYFKDLPMDVVLDLRFFLTNIIQIYASGMIYEATSKASQTSRFKVKRLPIKPVGEPEQKTL